jgi:predicted nucleic acid-binding protein
VLSVVGDLITDGVMLVDTTFLIDLAQELGDGRNGPAVRWARSHRNRLYWTSVVSLGELAAGMASAEEARRFIGHLRVARLVPEIAYEAAAIDRELLRTGQRLGENDNWIAGFARYYGEPLVSNDATFDRVGGIRRVAY